MTAESENLIQEDILNEFDDIVEMYGGVPRFLWDKNCPESLKAEIDSLPKSVDFVNIGNKKVRLENGDVIDDLRDLDFITVDPATCRDMDDAVCCGVTEEGDYVLYTAIADVPRYFDLPDSLDECEAMDSIGKVYLAGGYTMYTPFKAYEILPEKLSQDLCSLKEGEDRLAFVTKIVIDSKTGLQKGEPLITEAVIRSRAKLSYQIAQAIIDGELKNCVNCSALNNENVLFQVRIGKMVADVIRKGFRERDMVRFPDDDNRNIYTSDGMIMVENKGRIPYQDVIEAFMIMTNEANAKFARDNKINVIYRVHDNPSTNDVESLIKLLKYEPIFGFDEDMEKANDVSPGAFNRILDLVELEKDSIKEIYKRFLSRIQTRAKSSLFPHQITCCDRINGIEYKFSHFGLQSDCYMHITSPIRRITDTINIKNILAFIYGRQPISQNLVSQVSSHSNFRRKAVDEATACFDNLVAQYYFQQNSGFVNARICDFDYKNYSYCVFEDEKTGFKINVPIEELTSGVYFDQEKWGGIMQGKVIFSLGQREQLFVSVDEDMQVLGHLCFMQNETQFKEREKHAQKKQKVKKKRDGKDHRFYSSKREKYYHDDENE